MQWKLNAKKCKERTAVSFPVAFRETWPDDWLNLEVFYLLNQQIVTGHDFVTFAKNFHDN